MGVTVVGQATEDPADEVVLLKDAHGSPQAVVIAVPFLRERDVRVLSEHESAIDTERKFLVEGTARHYERCLERALELRGDAPIRTIATGHLFAAEAGTTESTRDLYVGSLGQIPADVFPKPLITWLSDTSTAGNSSEALKLAATAVPQFPLTLARPHWSARSPLLTPMPEPASLAVSPCPPLIVLSACRALLKNCSTRSES